MRKASEAQVRFIEAWSRSHGNELQHLLQQQQLGGIGYANLTSAQASLVISTMVSAYGKPKKGINGESGEAISNGQGENDGHKSGDDTREGEGQEQGESQGQGEGQQGEGQGEGEGQDNQDQQQGEGMTGEFKEGSKEAIAAQALRDNDMSTRRAYEQIKDQIGEGALEFKGNVGQGMPRQPLPLGSDHDGSNDRTQKGRTRKLLNDVKNAMEQNGGKQGQGQGQEQNDGQKGQQGGQGGSGGQQQLNKYEELLAHLHRARKIAADQNADGKKFDAVGMRPYVHAPKMLSAGLSIEAILDAMTMTWPKEIRRELNSGTDLPAADQRKYEKLKAIPEITAEEIEKFLLPLIKETEGKSAYLPILVALANKHVPILQVGEKGTGKTTNAEHLAQALAAEWDREMPFGFASMTSGTSPGEFKGRITLKDYLPSLFQSIYENGGVFLFDELDAGDENLLTLLNSALANKQFVNAQGDVINQHDCFVPIAAANTMGLGANGEYTGRNRQDAAVLDRWAMGRIRVEFDVPLAEYLFWTEVSNHAV